MYRSCEVTKTFGGASPLSSTAATETSCEELATEIGDIQSIVPSVAFSLYKYLSKLGPCPP